MTPSLKFHSRHYIALQKPLLDLCLHGVGVDRERLREMREELTSRLAELRREIDRLSGAGICKNCKQPSKGKTKIDVNKGLFCQGGKKARAPKWREVEACDCGIEHFTKCRKCKGREWLDEVVCPKCKSQCEFSRLDGGFQPASSSVFAKTDLANKKLAHLLYSRWELPELKERGSITVKEIALRRNLLRVQAWANGDGGLGRAKYFWKRQPKRVIALLTACLEHRTKSKLRTFLNVKKVDFDDRLRSQYKPLTRFSRLMCGSNPYKTGLNAQNIHRMARRAFVPDEGCVMLELDMSQVESRVVDVLTGDPELIKRAQLPSWEWDGHRELAAQLMSFIEKRPYTAEMVTPEQRKIGKTTKHGGNYDMQGARYSDYLLKHFDLIRTPEECDAFLSAYRKLTPAIPLWQLAVRKLVRSTGKIITSWGRVYDFSFMRKDESTYKDAYASYPQGDSGELMNVYGLVPISKFIRREGLKTRINIQRHDALILSTPPDETYLVAKTLRDFLERVRHHISPVTKERIPLRVPVEFKLGMNDAYDEKRGEGVEWKRLPKEREVREMAEMFLKRINQRREELAA